MGTRPTAASEPLVGLPPPWNEDDSASGRRPRPTPHSPFPLFSDESFQAPPAVADFVSFGADEEEDSMSISASEKNWAESERDHPDTEGPADLHDELARVLAKAVKELDLNWDASEEPARRNTSSPRRKLSFFPDIHEHVVKFWSAPQLAHPCFNESPWVCAHAPSRENHHPSLMPFFDYTGHGPQLTVQILQTDCTPC